MNVAAPQTGTPAAVRVQFLLRDSLKNCLAQRGPDEVAERPIRNDEELKKMLTIEAVA
jgi:hypothetical protein